MRLCTLDMETYYDPQYSLTKISTEEYIRSPLFEVIGLAYKFDDTEVVWVPGPQVRDWVKAQDWSDTMILAQNTLFDGAILAWHYDVKPRMWADTLGMSRALFPHEKQHGLKYQAIREGIGEKGNEVENFIGYRYKDFSPAQLQAYADYCCQDVFLTHQLFVRYMARGFPKKELRLIDLTVRMFTEPRLTLDKPGLEAHLARVQAAKVKLLDVVRDTMLEGADPEHVAVVFTEGSEGIKKMLMSNEKFAGLLEMVGVIPPTKVSLKTGKRAYAFAKTDEAFKALEEHPNPLVQALVAARLGNKTTLEESRTARFIGMADRGFFPVPLRYYGAATGRWSGQDSVNLQNLPSRGKNAKSIKKCITAPPGFVVIDCDSSQIEARCLAWEAGQEDLLEAFRTNADVYSNMASKIYGRQVNRKRVEIDPSTGKEFKPDQREGEVGKATILGAGYGMGGSKFQIYLKTMGITMEEDECGRVIVTYRSSVPRVTELWERGGEALDAMIKGQSHILDINGAGVLKVVADNRITLPTGLTIHYPELAKRFVDGKYETTYVSKGLPVRIYGPKVIENVTQAVARCVVGEQALRVAKKYPVTMMVHDSVVALARIAEREEAMAYITECMSWVPPWAEGLPLACEAGAALTYGDC